MNNLVMPVLLVMPVGAALLSLLVNRRRFDLWLLPLLAGAHLALAMLLPAGTGDPQALLAIDPLSRVFLLVLSLLFLATALYSADYLGRSKMEEREKRLYAPFLLLTLFAMTGVTMANHVGLLWIFIEATTLLSAPLIVAHKTRHSLEASWKYLYICSVGIALAFIGLLFLVLAGSGSGRIPLTMPALLAGSRNYNPLWLKLSFAFVLVGYGTKAGLAPTHTWLPDAHAEAPAGISALLSGTLLNCALLGILRFYQILRPTMAFPFARTVLLLSGLLSLFVCAVYILSIKDYKRMLAYSSMENMGIIAVGVAAGGLGTLGAVVHLVGHSLTKSSLFLTSGGILRLYQSKNREEVRGLLKADRPLGLLWLLGLLSLIAMPPFASFFSEILIIIRLLAARLYGQAAVFIVLLTAIMAGLSSAILRMALGEPSLKIPEGSCSRRERLLAQFPAFLLLGLAAVAALGLLAPAGTILRQAAGLLGGVEL